MEYAFLSGGTGTPKLMLGFRKILDDKQLGVVCNTGDDYRWFGLHISPDLDTIIYLFSNNLDLGKFWGVSEETFHSLATLNSLNEDTWFNVGDKDLGLHIFRTNLLLTQSLTEITKQICKCWQIKATILPMCDQLLQTIIFSNNNQYNFQEYFVKHKWQLSVDRVEFQGVKNKTSPDVLTLLNRSKNIILGPSNPITSMGPILSINPIKSILQKRKKSNIAVSPIVGKTAFSGPTNKLMQSQDIELSPLGLAVHYQNIISVLFLDPSDQIYNDPIMDLGIEPVYLDINISSDKQQRKLAQSILDFI